MAKYIIEGGVPLKGKVFIHGAKNAGFKQMIASLLSDERSTISNIPYIRDVVSAKKIIESIGPKVEFSDDTIQIAGSVTSSEIPEELGLRSRASFMYLPILLHRFKKAKVFLPGGDKIGDRPINWFLEALGQMGAKVEKTNGSIQAESPNGLSGVNYTFPKNSHTGTEALLMASVLAKGKTKIENAAAEPEVDDLISFLNKMGAKIKRTGERTIVIDGTSTLKGAVHKVMPDRNEAATFSAMVLGTKGEIEIEGFVRDHMTALEEKIKAAGGGWEVFENRLKVFYKNSLRPTQVVTKAYPGFMTDWQSQWTALMTQAEGESIIHETVFENRFSYVDFLKKMGANIELFDPEVKNPATFYNFEWNQETEKLMHAAKVTGPTELKSTQLEITDIRAGATLVFAALMAEGKSEIFGIEHVDRGYEDLEGRLERLGARIMKVE